MFRTNRGVSEDQKDKLLQQISEDIFWKPIRFKKYSCKKKLPELRSGVIIIGAVLLRNLLIRMRPNLKQPSKIVARTPGEAERKI